MNQTKAQKGLANSLSKRYAVTLLIHTFPTILKLLTAKRLIQTPFDAGHLTLLVLKKLKNSIEVSIFLSRHAVTQKDPHSGVASLGYLFPANIPVQIKCFWNEFCRTLNRLPIGMTSFLLTSIIRIKTRKVTLLNSFCR